MMVCYRPFSSTVSAEGRWVGRGRSHCHWHHQRDLRTPRSQLQGQRLVGIAFGHSQISSQGCRAQWSSHEMMLKARHFLSVPILRRRSSSPVATSCCI